MNWQPTHTIPQGGLQVWDQPDGNLAAVASLDRGVRVQVVEVRGPWGRIVCDNGFTGWVDSGKLVALAYVAASPATVPAASPPSIVAAGPSRSNTERNRVLLWAAAAGVVLFGVIGALVAAGSSDEPTQRRDQVDIDDDEDAAPPDDDDEGDDERDDEGSGEPGSRGAAIVDLDVPAGWSVSDDGLVAAEDEDDLDREEPEGPVVRAEVGGDEDIDFDALLEDALADAEEGDFAFTEPEEQQVDGFDAVSLSIRANGRVQALVAVHPPGEDAVLFVIDSPADRFDELKTLLGTIPGLDVG